MTDFGLDLAVIGNGRTAALIEPSSRLVWWCFPRFDGDPVFCRLLAGNEEKGFCDVVLDGMVATSSDYVGNTALVSTVLTDRNDAAVRITDFAPRFREFDRVFRPSQLVRIIEPIAGLPRIVIRFRRAATECRFRQSRSAAITSHSTTVTWRCGSPPTRHCPTSIAKHRSC
jgi:GH15 family glucan-1,4-alpha-glucosidase